MSNDQKVLKEALNFMAEAIASYVNTLDPVARKPVADVASIHMRTIVAATQDEPEKEGKKK